MVVVHTDWPQYAQVRTTTTSIHSRDGLAYPRGGLCASGCASALHAESDRTGGRTECCHSYAQQPVGSGHSRLILLRQWRPLQVVQQCARFKTEIDLELPPLMTLISHYDGVLAHSAKIASK